METIFPRIGIDEEAVRAQVEAMLDETRQARLGCLPGKPDTPPHPLGIDIWSRLSTVNPNNGGVHTWDARGTHALGRQSVWSSTRRVEGELVGMLAHLYGLSSATADGYMTSGGTEANLAALWLGRNKLHGTLPDGASCGGGGLAVLAPRTAHFSIRKACNLLGLGEGTWQLCPRCGFPHDFVPAPEGTGLHLLDVDDAYQLDLNAFEQRLQELAHQEVRRFLVVLTAGTTITGSVDPIEAVSELLEVAGKRYGILSYLHVDAAFGGLVLPFLNGQGESFPPFDWSRWPAVDSVGVDWHKMGLVPYSAGTFLCRKGLLVNISRDAGYITTGLDATVTGSRSGAMAAACWGVVQVTGFEGFSTMISRCMGRAERLREALRLLTGVHVLPTAPVNLVTISLARGTRNADKIRTLLGRHGIHSEWNSSRRGECPEELFPIYMMPHVREEHIARFVEELAALTE